jgi:hypothetical protein
MGDTIQEWLAKAAQCGCAGRQNPNDPFASLYPTIADRNMPASSPQGLPHFTAEMTASLIARGMIYYKNSPGDCGSPTSLDLTSASLAKSGGSVASAGLSVGLAAAQIGGAAAAGATAGLSVAISAIVEVFHHHAQAVATEQETLCRMANIVNQVIPHVDALVANGTISPSDGEGQLANFVEQVNGQLQAIEKTCNAACFYQGILNAHADFAKSYYPALAPPQILAPLAPFSAPVSLYNSPGGVPAASLGIAHTLSGVPAVSGFVLTTQDLLLGGIVLLIIFIFISLRRSNG